MADGTVYIVDGEKVINQTEDFYEACRYYVKNASKNKELKLMTTIPNVIVAAAYLADYRERERWQEAIE